MMADAALTAAVQAVDWSVGYAGGQFTAALEPGINGLRDISTSLELFELRKTLASESVDT